MKRKDIEQMIRVLRRQTGKDYTLSVYKPGSQTLYALELDGSKKYGHVSAVKIGAYLEGFLAGLDAK